ncbi:uncharacterized protein CLUP02_10864 [Colletotrichum lupini]|uniref:Uncharacterized protein n=1 Tax=Colletotrichum lupini TaxID=145971 RepID=A0A9Q8SZA7_9PEZI|nr:uncharacterized protein CLUP02_10864 [Colletotrichum lupini]UQC85367.1 hypothetical protein CLUP02_10864 [Colletotrichum lupini]
MPSYGRWRKVQYLMWLRGEPLDMEATKEASSSGDVFPQATCSDDLLKGEARAGYGCGCDGGFAHEKEADEELGPRGVSGVEAQLGFCGSDLVSRRGLEDRSGPVFPSVVWNATMTLHTENGYSAKLKAQLEPLIDALPRCYLTAQPTATEPLIGPWCERDGRGSVAVLC